MRYVLLNTLNWTLFVFALITAGRILSITHLNEVVISYETLTLAAGAFALSVTPLICASGTIRRKQYHKPLLGVAFGSLAAAMLAAVLGDQAPEVQQGFTYGALAGLVINNTIYHPAIAERINRRMSRRSES